MTTNKDNINERELFKVHREEQKKYTYFLLATSGAAIGFAVNQTQSSALTWSQIPLGFAVLCWGLSFFFGCRHVQYVVSNLFANLALFKVQRGEHPNLESNSLEERKIASQGIREAMESNSNEANRYFKKQFRFLIIGAVLFIVWHILEMFLRIPPKG